MVYVHPILGILTVLLVGWLAIHGLRARHAAPYALGSRRRHGRWALRIFGLWAATLATGLASTALLRDDLPAARSAHFGVACVGFLLFASAWWLSRNLAAPWARRVHPWVGLGGLATALALAVLGMRLLP